MNAQANKSTQFSKAGRPWGQKILREKSIEILREGKVAPSALMGNLLAASASPVLDTDMLSSAPRAMSAEANRVISLALQRSRMPHADLGAILDELIGLTWVAKASSAQTDAMRPASAPQHGKAAKPGFKAKPAGKPPSSSPKTAAAAPAPIIVRKQAKLPSAE